MEPFGVSWVEALLSLDFDCRWAVVGKSHGPTGSV